MPDGSSTLKQSQYRAKIQLGKILAQFVELLDPRLKIDAGSSQSFGKEFDPDYGPDYGQENGKTFANRS